jgi:hypothetical protein
MASGASISTALSLQLPFTSTALAGATAAVGVRRGRRSNCLARVDGGDRDGVGDEGRPGFRPPPSDR